MAELENTTETETPSLTKAEAEALWGQLAAALGRTYASVQHRQAILRERGLLP